MSEASTAEVLDQLSPTEVEDWLVANPDFIATFLKKRPELFEDLAPAKPAGVSSIIDKQINVLRADNQRLDKLLRQISHSARRNLSILEELLGLTLSVAQADGADRAIAILAEGLKSRFDLDFVRVVLSRDASDDYRELFAELLDKRDTRCGRLRPAQRQWLFEDSLEEIQSEALVVLTSSKTDAQPLGLLALGSHDADRYTPAQGTELLDRLGLLIGEVLETRHGVSGN